MGKALVIKGTDFSTNKVTTVTFANIPCTGITFASNEISLGSLDPVTVECTVTPSNTTDSIIWASSDESVFTVDSGTITPVGFGTATLTATCGEQSANATVTISVAYIENFKFYNFNESDNHLGGGANRGRLSIVGSGSQACIYAAGVASDLQYPVKIPSGISTIKLKHNKAQDSLLYNASSALIVRWLIDEPAPDSGYSTFATYVSKEEVNPRSSIDGVNTFTIPDEVNAFVATYRLNTTYTESDDPATIAETIGLEVIFE